MRKREWLSWEWSVQQYENCARRRASHVVSFRSFGTSHERSKSTKNWPSRKIGIQTSKFTNFKTLLCVSVCTHRVIFYYSPTWHSAMTALRIKKFPNLTGGAAATPHHSARSCIMMLACMSVCVWNTLNVTRPHTDTASDAVSVCGVCTEYRHDARQSWGACRPDTFCREHFAFDGCSCLWAGEYLPPHNTV